MSKQTHRRSKTTTSHETIKKGTENEAEAELKAKAYRGPEMNGEDLARKFKTSSAGCARILDELRELEKTSQDTSVKQMAISAALALAWVDLVENFRTKEDNDE